MIILFKINGRTTEVTINGHTVKHKTAFLNKLSFKDCMTWLIAESKKSITKR